MKLFGESCKQMDWVRGKTLQTLIKPLQKMISWGWSRLCRANSTSTINAPIVAASPRPQGWSAAFQHEPKTISKITNTTTTSTNILSCCVYNCCAGQRSILICLHIYCLVFYSYHLTHVSDFNTVSPVLQPRRLTAASSSNNSTIYWHVKNMVGFIFNW